MGDGFCLAALFRVDAGIGAGGIDQRQHGQAEALGQPHQSPRLAIPFRPPHAEIVLEPSLGIRAFFGAEHEDAAPAKATDAADNGGILGEDAVAGEWHEISDQPADVIEAMRPFGMSGHLNLLPRGQARIGLAQQPGGAALQAPDLVGNIEFAGRRKPAQFLDLAFELGDRPLEIEKVADHLRRASGWAVSISVRSRSVSTCV